MIIYPLHMLIMQVHPGSSHRSRLWLHVTTLVIPRCPMVVSRNPAMVPIANDSGHPLNERLMGYYQGLVPRVPTRPSSW
jgi:hypothetical protein